MARKSTDVEPERSKVRVFYAEAEGTPQSIQDLLRSLTAVMSRPAVAPPARLVAADRLHSSGQGNGQQATATMEPEPADTVDVVVDQPSNGEQSTDAAEQPRRKRGDGSNRDRNASLSIVKSLNLMPDGKESLKAFVSSKKPENQMEHVAVYIYYLKNILEEPKVGFSHMFTCFKNTGERMPLDLPQTCRNAGSQKGWIDTSSQEDLKIPTAGVNFVEHELPQPGTAS